MLDIILFVIATAFGGGDAQDSATAGATPEASVAAVAQTAQEAAVPAQTATEPAAPAAPTLPAAPGLEAEPQVPTGRFTTAVEVKPILTATKANWLAVREFNGQDLVYITHLWAWRCGLLKIEVAFNGEDLWQNWPMPACHEDTVQPNAIKPEDGDPYISGPLGGMQQVKVRITYDDLTTDETSFQRAQILMP